MELIERWDEHSVLSKTWSQCEGTETLVEDKNLIDTDTSEHTEGVVQNQND